MVVLELLTNCGKLRIKDGGVIIEGDLMDFKEVCLSLEVVIGLRKLELWCFPHDPQMGMDRTN